MANRNRPTRGDQVAAANMVRSTAKLPRPAPEPTATEPVARRQMQLLGIVREQGFCTIGELARLLGVS